MINDGSAIPARPPGPSISDVLSRPWLFSQSAPLATDDLITQFKRRGVSLGLPMLRELYRQGILVPFIEVTDRPFSSPVTMSATDPVARGTRLIDFRGARATGRYRDLAQDPFRPRLRWDCRPGEHGWWNRLLYSRYQLLSLPYVSAALTRVVWTGPRGARRPRLPTAADLWMPTDRMSRIALTLTALEPRYLPVIKPGWIQLSNAERDEWESYRTNFDCARESELLRYSGQQARDDAEWLLDVAERLDPNGDWSDLIARGQKRHWKQLGGATAITFDHRIAAELLLLFVEDLAASGAAELPRPPAGSMVRHSLHGRMGGEQPPLDDLLYDLGVSPHPRVLLIVEGETEEFFVAKLQRLLGYGESKQLVRVLRMGGADKNLELIAAFAAPAVGEFRAGTFDLTRPPTEVHVAIDPDGGYGTPAGAERKRRVLVDSIQRVVEAQGASLLPEELDRLVTLRVWSAKCFEFEHFTDDELAAALLAVHPDCNGLDEAGLLAALGAKRGTADVGKVWSAWTPKPSKLVLADALWPILERKVLAAIEGTTCDVPAIAEVVDGAHATAQGLAHGRFVMRGAPVNGIPED